VKVDGDRAEAAAAAWLEQQGLQVRDRNFRSRFGEIDLICEERGTLVFVEVRKRSSERFGGAAESITAAKRSKLLATARIYLASLKHDMPCRFDAILIDGSGRIDWIRDAFGA
jgi:putative endonuclease